MAFKNRALSPSICLYTRMEDKEAETLLQLQGPDVVECLSTAPLPNGKKSVVLKKYDCDAFSLTNRTIKISTLSQRILFARRAVAAVGRLHKKGYVHGDIKLENILLQLKNGTIDEVRLCDFGMTSANIKENRKDKGSLDTIAPEMVELASFSNDERTADIWALGCSLFKCEFLDNIPWINNVTDLYQRRGDLFLSRLLFMKRFSEAQDWLQTGNSVVEIAYRQILSRMLTRDPARRITAEQAEERLAKLPSGEPSFLFTLRTYAISLLDRGLCCCC